MLPLPKPHDFICNKMYLNKIITNKNLLILHNSSNYFHRLHRQDQSPPSHCHPHQLQTVPRNCCNKSEYAVSSSFCYSDFQFEEMELVFHYCQQHLHFWSDYSCNPQFAFLLHLLMIITRFLVNNFFIIPKDFPWDQIRISTGFPDKITMDKIVHRNTKYTSSL